MAFSGMGSCVLVSFAASLFALAGCGDDTGGGGSGGGVGGGSSVTDADLQPVMENYAANVHANYEAALDKAEALKTAVDAFVAAPSEATQDAAKQAWLDARPVFLESEVYRFYNGPIDNEETGVEGQLNGWPLDESYIDYTQDAATAGIINDPAGFPVIDKQMIADANEAIDEKSLSAGYHAVEFLLWGQDLNVEPTDAGLRSFTDYTTATNADRRGDYLKAVTEKIVNDLGIVEAAWEPGAEYPTAFNADPRGSLQKILTGMGSLSGGELKNERINNAFQEKDQEEEHSCFSDNTHIDHLHDAIGIENVYLGRFGSNDGPGLDDLVKKVDPALDEQMKADLTAAIEAIKAIPIPFDQAIQGNPPGARDKIQVTLDALDKLTVTTEAVAAALDVTLTLE